MTNPRRRKRRPIAPDYSNLVAPAPVPYTPYPPMIPFNDPPRASIQVLRDKNATVANVVVSQVTDYTKGPDYQVETSGSTKREQGDRYDQRAGDLMAIGRALRNAGNEMISEANKRVQDIVEDQAEERRRAAERRENKSKPVKRRTRAEWEAMQRAEQQERNREMARKLGMAPATEWGSYSSVAHVMPAASDPVDVEPMYQRADGAGIPLSNGRTMRIEDDRVTILDIYGHAVMVIDRA
jgi:hypothetical protein